MLKVGLTGGMGSGKSTVARRFAELGAVIIDADQIARDVVEPGEPALAELAEAFGEGILLDDGSLNRGELAKRAFVSAEKTELLNSITHPRIEQRTEEQFNAAGDAIIVFDSPLLIEMGQSEAQDLVVVVHTPVEVRLDRLVESRGVDREDAKQRIAKQISDDKRLQFADVVLENSGTEEDLVRQVDRIWERIIQPLNQIRQLQAGQQDNPVAAQ
ncbi:dephospho-CoA kinase [Corynebacterium sp. HMSC061H03]|uniref:dephospho-CoA kinase n=1 Tax=Corynebacterium TaxID=1716 RepID=UPI0008A3C06C|nr:MULTISPECIES: dephospho-CoA kinase [Corynebacterium]MDC7119252.1 dephospho-CoA kinase [Corynebacterium amycolatum]MDK7314879.1 dephospho-CoA kinase [Corynebacterium amycolatum]MEB2596386.1 dephospho-CoA kinase [Corynebacterium amycolatum]OFK32968.1 dephospho-CoA kinase [Corynebacterium sp. HMSC064E08]OHR21655.1 dephospho-CoA kinase [Corynebacterium sp. HMSC061H03]